MGSPPSVGWVDSHPFVIMADAAPAIIWITDAGGRCIFVNKAWLDFTGRDMSTVVDDGWLKCVHSDDRESVGAGFDAAVGARRHFEMEYRMQRADGVFRWMLGRSVPRLDAHGGLAGYIGSSFDITERKAVEVALRTSENRFRLLAENARDMIYRFRVAPSISAEYISPAALAITGHRPDEFYANPQLGLTAIHPDDRHLAAQPLHQDPAKLDTTVLLRWLHPDGRVVWAEHHRVPIVDENGRLIAIEGVGRDVTERVDAQRRLAASESRFRFLAENARDLVYRYTLEPFRCEYVSPAAIAITGYRPEDFYADPELAWHAVHPDDRAALAHARKDPRRFEEPVLLRWRHPDGRMVHAEHRNTLLYNAKGVPVAIEGIGRDVTENLAYQDRLRESESQLRRLAASVEEAREKERALIARELHDELGQSLTAIKLELIRTSRALMPLGLAPGAIDGLQSIIGGVDVATETVRRLATSLRPPALDHLGLVAAIELEASALGRRTGVRCRVAGTGGSPGWIPRAARPCFASCRRP